MVKHQEKIALALLVAVYLLCGFRYFPDQPGKTLFITTRHFLTTAPFIIGSLIIIISLVKKVAGKTLSAVKTARLYLTMGIVLEFFLGIYNYLKINA